MRVLLDECVNRRLAGFITGHQVLTVAAMGWSGVKNGALLALAAEQFGVFITLDRGIAFQQDVAKLPIAVIVIRARTNRIADLAPMVPELLDALSNAEPRSLSHVGVASGL